MEGSGGGGRARGRLYTYQWLPCHHRNDSCIKMGTDECHFNVSFIVRDKVTNRHNFDHNFRSGIEPRSLCLPA